jgi:hypothetical protein
LDGPGDTWARRAAAGQVEGLDASPDWERVATSVSGVFQVWPGPQPWVRDALRGTAGPLVGEPSIPGDGDRPVALWELRVHWDDDGARSWREPITYPLELAPWLEERRVASLTGRAPPPLMELRRGWLRRFRNPRVSVGAAFNL